MYRQWKPYVPVAQRRLNAARELQKIAKKGRSASPVVIDGRKIAQTFWGKAWCENLEGYGDYENRLPRGRTYVRNGSVVDLQLSPGQVDARVSGSRLYQVTIKVKALEKSRWTALSAECAGAIDSVVELLQGRFARGVMERLCHRETGLFPAPVEIEFSCSCPDYAAMCKHVAASLYGVGARLDQSPELFFTLRQVDAKDLIAQAGRALALPGKGPASEKVLGGDDLSELFGIELGSGDPEQAPETPKAPQRAKAPKAAKAPKTPAPKVRKKAPPKAGPAATPAGASALSRRVGTPSGIQPVLSVRRPASTKSRRS